MRGRPAYDSDNRAARRKSVSHRLGDFTVFPGKLSYAVISKIGRQGESPEDRRTGSHCCSLDRIRLLSCHEFIFALGIFISPRIRHGSLCRQSLESAFGTQQHGSLSRLRGRSLKKQGEASTPGRSHWICRLRPDLPTWIFGKREFAAALLERRVRRHRNDVLFYLLGNGAFPYGRPSKKAVHPCGLYPLGSIVRLSRNSR